MQIRIFSLKDIRLQKVNPFTTEYTTAMLDLNLLCITIVHVVQFFKLVKQLWILDQEQMNLLSKNPLKG